MTRANSEVSLILSVVIVELKLRRSHFVSDVPIVFPVGLCELFRSLKVSPSLETLGDIFTNPHGTH